MLAAASTLPSASWTTPSNHDVVRTTGQRDQEAKLPP
jgi:hypothetical protein